MNKVALNSIFRVSYGNSLNLTLLTTCEEENENKICFTHKI